MEFFADSPRFVRRRFHAAENQVTHLIHSQTCTCLKCQIFTRSQPQLGMAIPVDALDAYNRTQVHSVDTMGATEMGGGSPSRTKQPHYQSPTKKQTKQEGPITSGQQFRDFEWLLMKMKGAAISGVSNLYKDENGTKSYDVTGPALAKHLANSAAEAEEGILKNSFCE